MDFTASIVNTGDMKQFFHPISGLRNAHTLHMEDSHEDVRQWETNLRSTVTLNSKSPSGQDLYADPAPYPTVASSSDTLSVAGKAEQAARLKADSIALHIMRNHTSANARKIVDRAIKDGKSFREALALVLKIFRGTASAGLTLTQQLTRQKEIARTIDVDYTVAAGVLPLVEAFTDAHDELCKLGSTMLDGDTAYQKILGCLPSGKGDIFENLLTPENSAIIKALRWTTADWHASMNAFSDIILAHEQQECLKICNKEATITSITMATMKTGVTVPAIPGKDQIIHCAGECGTTFIFSIKDQAHYKTRDFATPRRCSSCRAARSGSISGGATGGAAPATGAARVDNRACFRCHQSGHIAKTCTAPAPSAPK